MNHTFLNLSCSPMVIMKPLLLYSVHQPNLFTEQLLLLIILLACFRASYKEVFELEQLPTMSYSE